MSTTNEALSRGLCAGDYANAYTSEDLTEAWDEMVDEDAEGFLSSLSPDDHDVFRAAFVIGFFGSYENDEIGDDEARAELFAATREYGPAIRALGLVCDERERDELCENE